MKNRKQYTNGEYHNLLPQLSSSGLKTFMECREEYKMYYIDKVQQTRTPAMILGSAAHKWVLESESFAEEYYVLPPEIEDRRKANYRDACMPDVENILHKDFAKFYAMKEALFNNPDVQKYIRGGDVEQTFFGTIHTKECKVRPDRIIGGTVIDYKTTTLDRLKAVNKYSSHAYELKYAESMVFYKKILEQNGYDVRNIIHLVQSKTAPYISRPIEFSLEWLEYAEQRVNQGIYDLLDAEKWEDWKTFKDIEPVTIYPPTWGYQEIV